MFYTYNILDKTIYEHLYKAVVTQGWYPDERPYRINDDVAGFNTELAVIKQLKNTAIRVLGHGTPDSRDEQRMAQFVINRMGAQAGSVSTAGVTFYVPKATDGGFPFEFPYELGDNGAFTVFDKYQYPDKTKHVKYEIRLRCDSAAVLEVMQTLMEEVFGTMSNLSVVNTDTHGFYDQSFLFKCMGEINMSMGHEFEWLYRFEVRDVYVSSPRLIKANIPQLTSIGFRAALRPIIDFPDPDTITPEDPYIILDQE